MNAISVITTMMATSMARIYGTHCIPRTAPHSICLSYACRRRAMMSAWSSSRNATPTPTRQSVASPNSQPPLHDSPPAVVPTSNARLNPDASSPQIAARPPPAPKVTRPKPTIRAQKAALILVSTPRPLHLSFLVSEYSFHFVQTPLAVDRLRILMSSPTPQLVRIGVRNKGCAGLSYHLEYVDRPAKFDEVVKQDGVNVIIDSKALFSIIGSEMDWHEDALRYVPLFSQASKSG